MAWIWRYEDENGRGLPTVESDAFTSKSDAESWLGETWRALLDQGVHQVTLVEDGRIEYGPMSLQDPM